MISVFDIDDVETSEVATAGVLLKTVLLEISQIHRKTPASLYFNKVAVSKFLRTSFLQSTSKRLLLKLTEFTKSNVRSWRVWKSWSSHWLIKVRCFTSLHRCPLSNKCCRRGHFFNKQVEYCESVSILKGS